MAESKSRETLLITAEDYYPVGGGIQQYLRGLSAELTDRGYDIIILTQSYEGEPPVRERPEATVHYSDLLTGSMSEPFDVRKNAPEIAEFIADVDPAVVYSNNHNSLALIDACEIADVPVVYGCHGVGLLCSFGFRFLKPDGELCYNEQGYRECTDCFFRQDRNILSNLARFSFSSRHIHKHKRAQKILTRADARIANSQLCADLLPTEEMTFSIHLGVDTEQYAPRSDPSVAERFDVTEPYLFVPGRLKNIKGQKYVVRALARLDDEWDLVITGDKDLYAADEEELGKYGREVRDEIQRLGVQGRATMTGFVEKEVLTELYTAATVTVVPSIYLETFGYTVVEALSCATPVVVTDNCGAAECVDDSCGRIVPRMDPDAIARAVTEIRPDADAMGRRGRERIECDLNWKRTADRVLDVFEQVWR